MDYQEAKETFGYNKYVCCYVCSDGMTGGHMLQTHQPMYFKYVQFSSPGMMNSNEV